MTRARWCSRRSRSFSLNRQARTRRLNRLDLAQWLCSPDNPLTARTFVNRLWMLMFGAGISPSVDDLGSQGQWPTHPDLLDWLTVEFTESGWDVKHLVKTAGDVQHVSAEFAAAARSAETRSLQSLVRQAITLATGRRDGTR